MRSGHAAGRQRFVHRDLDFGKRERLADHVVDSPFEACGAFALVGLRDCFSKGSPIGAWPDRWHAGEQRQKVAGVGYDVLFDGAPVALVGDLPDLNLMLDAFNARRAPA